MTAPPSKTPGQALPSRTDEEHAHAPAKAVARNLSFFYGTVQALKDVTLDFPERRVTALIGPSGCGKTTFLRCFNRMHDLYPGNRYEGEIVLQPDNINLLSPKVDPIELRMRVGMVFQKSNPFPKSIYENVAYGLRIQGVKDRRRLDEIVEQSLRGAALWDEAKDRLHENALGLSGELTTICGVLSSRRIISRRFGRSLMTLARRPIPT